MLQVVRLKSGGPLLTVLFEREGEIGVAWPSEGKLTMSSLARTSLAEEPVPLRKVIAIGTLSEDQEAFLRDRMSNKIEVGSVVTLLSGGIRMTIEELTGESAVCVYFLKGRLLKQTLPLTALTSNPPDESPIVLIGEDLKGQ